MSIAYILKKLFMFLLNSNSLGVYFEVKAKKSLVKILTFSTNSCKNKKIILDRILLCQYLLSSLIKLKVMASFYNIKDVSHYWQW